MLELLLLLLLLLLDFLLLLLLLQLLLVLSLSTDDRLPRVMRLVTIQSSAERVSLLSTRLSSSNTNRVLKLDFLRRLMHRLLLRLLRLHSVLLRLRLNSRLQLWRPLPLIRLFQTTICHARALTVQRHCQPVVFPPASKLRERLHLR